MAFDSVDFELWMDANGFRIPLTAFSSTYGMNAIPTAAVTLPVGIRHDTLLPSESHALFDSLGMHLVPAKVWVRAWRRPGAEFHSPIPGNRVPILLFDGLITIPGYRRSTESLGLSLTLIHWLDILNASSTLSSQAYPGSPLNYLFNAVINSDNPAGGSLLPITRAQKTIGEAAIQEDLWEKGIKPWFLELASEDKLNIRELGVSPSLEPQEQVTEALNKIRTPEGVPLKLDTGHSADVPMLSNIQKEIADVTFSATSRTNSIPGMAQTTFWNKVVGQLGPVFLFSLVPRPSDTLVVPFIAGLRSFYDPRSDGVTVWARDIDYIDVGGSLARPVRGLALFTDDISSPYGKYSNSSLQETNLVGVHHELNEGMVIFMRAPHWMSSVTADPLEYSKSTLVRNSSNKIRPQAPNSSPPGESVREQEIRANESMLTSRSRFAQALYAFECLKGRGGQISGGFRTDICPGSSIKIEGIGKGTPAIHADVMRVTTEFDADARRSATTFQLAHIRTESENQNDATSTPRHPIYTSVWSGSPLFGE